MARASLTSLLAPGAFDRPVDQVGADERAAKFTKRSIKTGSKLQGLKMVVSMTDLTTLEGKDSPGKVRQMCAKAVRPDPRDPSVPPVAAVCVYPNLVPTAVKALKGTGVHVASVDGWQERCVWGWNRVARMSGRRTSDLRGLRAARPWFPCALLNPPRSARRIDELRKHIPGRHAISRWTGPMPFTDERHDAHTRAKAPGRSSVPPEVTFTL